MDLGDFSRFGAMRTRRLDRRTCALCALAAMTALLAARFSGREPDVTDLPPRTPGAAPLLYGRSIGHGGRIEFERAHRGALPRLVIISGRTFDESTITDAMGLFDRALDTRAPFTVMWDPRLLRFPRVSPRQLRLVHGWVRDNVVRWDTQAQARHYRLPHHPSSIARPAHGSPSRAACSAQAHAIIITNPLVRPLVRLCFRLFAPPQPSRIVNDEAAALAFARTCCANPRSWVKDSYDDRDSRYSFLPSLPNPFSSGSEGKGGGGADGSARLRSRARFAAACALTLGVLVHVFREWV